MVASGVRSTIWMPVVSPMEAHTDSSSGTSATTLHSSDRLETTARATSSIGSSPLPPRASSIVVSSRPTPAGIRSGAVRWPHGPARTSEVCRIGAAPTIGVRASGGRGTSANERPRECVRSGPT